MTVRGGWALELINASLHAKGISCLFSLLLRINTGNHKQVCTYFKIKSYKIGNLNDPPSLVSAMYFSRPTVLLDSLTLVQLYTNVGPL